MNTAFIGRNQEGTSFQFVIEDDLFTRRSFLAMGLATEHLTQLLFSREGMAYFSFCATNRNNLVLKLSPNAWCFYIAEPITSTRPFAMEMIHLTAYSSPHTYAQLVDATMAYKEFFYYKGLPMAVILS